MKGIRLVGFALVMLLAVGTGIAVGQDDPGEAGTADDAAPQVVREIHSERTASSRTVELRGGALRTEIFEAPIHYRAADGTWKPIGEEIQPQADGTGFENGSNEFDVTLPERLGAGPIRLVDDGQWVSSRLLGGPTEAGDLNGEDASYEADMPGTTFKLDGLANGIKEDIVVSSADQVATYSFELEASDGLRPELLEDGSIEFRDAEGQTFAVLPAPVMFDSTPESPKVSSDISYELHQRDSGSGWVLTIQPGKDWLERPDLVGPIHIDPPLKLENPSLDCTFGGTKTPGGVPQTLEGTNGWGLCGSGGQKQLYAYYRRNGSTDEWARSLLKFDLSSLEKLVGGFPKKEIYIAKAKVKVHAPGAAVNTSGLELRRATKSWTSSVKWNKYNGFAFWSLIGGDYNSEGTELLTKDRGSQAGWWEFADKGMAKLVETWLNNGQIWDRNGFLLKLLDDTKIECNPSCKERSVTFDSSAATEAAKRPKMEIEYFEKAPSTSKLASPMDGTQSARRFRLKATWESGVTGVTFQYRKGDKGRFEDIPTEFVKDAEGKAVAEWPIPTSEGAEETAPVYFDATALEPKYKAEVGKLQLRALFYGGAGLSGFSTPSNATVNPDVGGTADATEAVGPGSLDLLTGNYTVSRTDFTIPSPLGGVSVSRTHSSRDAGPSGDTGVLGRGWKPTSLVEEAGGADWRSVREVPPTAEEAEEGFGGYALLTDLKGNSYAFEKEGETFYAPPELTGWSLTRGTETFTLSDSKGNKTVFSNGGSGTEYLPKSITMTGSGDNSAKYVYDLVNGKRRLKTLVAPSGSRSCSEGLNFVVGCHILEFSYKAATNWGGLSSYGDRLASITYWGPKSGSEQGSWTVAEYKYDSAGRLIAEWDPRLSALKETYTYVGSGSSEAAGQLLTLDPPGTEPWTFQYKALSGEKAEAGRLASVKRPSLFAGSPTAQTTIVYGVPTSGGGAPYEMSRAEIAKWGQEDLPLDATAIFGPDEVPSSPPSSYSKATVLYMDAEGMAINTASPSGAGTSVPAISTVETDEFGNVIRELTPQNRIRALEAGAGSAPLSHEIDTKLKYSKDGTQLQEEWGPLHQVRLQDTGETKPARLHTVYGYDKGWPETGIKPHLITTETTGASIKGKGVDADQRVTETKYDWTLFRPIETIVDPGGLELKTVLSYNKETGQLLERRTPGGEKFWDANTTRIKYYRGGGAGGECGGFNPAVAGYVDRPCEIGPASQPGTAGLPEVLVTKYTAYGPFGRSTEVLESPGGGTSNVRKTVFTYDAIGRQVSRKQEGGGTSVPKTETDYDSTSGLPIAQRFVCESCDNQEVVTSYDALGRPIQYSDADGNVSKAKYDLMGRLATVEDGKGTQTFGYDSTSGLLTKLEDSAAGTFTAAYDAGGNMIEQGLPNGLVAKTTYDEVGAPSKLSYTKATSTWLEESNERSIYGQILAKTSLASNQQYGYDSVGRLTLVKDTPQGGGCTTRSYEYDKDSNRQALLTRAPGAGGACDTESSVTPQKYSYDAADRLVGEVTYDPFGRITNLPGKYAGGGALSTTFYSNDMIASQSQGGITNSYQLDSMMRPRQRVQTGGSGGTEVFHYSTPSDSPSWIDQGSKWTRNIVGIGGQLAAIQESSGETKLQLANLHGDVVATASLSTTATGPTATFESDEFGNPKKGGTPRYGWLGGRQRRTELPSGIVQMGVRSYIPALGRFISVDPVAGGSANTYDYANADPVNQADPSGAKPWDIARLGPCEGNIHVYSPKVRRSAGTRGGYGKFYMRYRINCDTPTYRVWVYKIIRAFRVVGSDDYIARTPRQPADPGGDHWQGEWGNWNGTPTQFDCLLGTEYEYQYEMIIKWSSFLGVITDGKDSVEGGGEGTLRLHAQEYCGHGSY